MITIYFFINLLFLTKFPFVHSDEPWLSGLSRSIMEHRDFSATETFFNIYPRNPHAIKILFHSLQIGFIKILGYNIFTFRLISLIFGILTLFIFYKLSELIFKSSKISLVAALILGFDTQYIYASHFARQEIILLFIFLAALYFFLYNLEKHKYIHDIILGIILGLSIGFHPNSFIISLPFGFIYLYYIFRVKKLKIKNIFIWGLTLALFAGIFVAISLTLDPNFFTNYAKYGEQFGVLDPVTSKLEQIKYFYLKLYYGVSGTYYLPNIRLQFYLFGITLFLSVIKCLFSEKNHLKNIAAIMILSIVAVNGATIFVGRYNQTSIVFIFPLFYLLLVYIFHDLDKLPRILAMGLIIAVLATASYLNIKPWLKYNYNNYINEISKFVKPTDNVLANLNSEYYFENGRLFDYRNLAFLKDNNMTFSDYIKKYNIKYIIYPEEMDFIYNTRPVWNGLYGNTVPYYEDMQSFLKNRCERIYEFTDRIYGMRIVQYIDTKNWKVKIYKVKE